MSRMRVPMVSLYEETVEFLQSMCTCVAVQLNDRPVLVAHFIPRLSTITDNWHVAETVSREISLSRKSYFALMPHRKVDFSHSQAAFDLLCPFVSLLPLPGELRRAKLVMMPQQASVFHQPVLSSDGSHLDNNRAIHFSSSLDRKLYL